MVDKKDEFSDPSVLGKGTNWQDAIFRTALQHQHQVSAQGGTDKVKYYVSGNYMNQDGTIIGSDFSRYGARVNLDAQLKKWFKLGLSANYSNTDQRLLKADQDEGVINYALTSMPDVPIYDIEGGYTSISREGVTNPNPVALALMKDILYKRNSLVGNVFAEISFMKNLVWHTEIGYNFNWDRAEVFEPTVNLGSWVQSKNMAQVQKTTGSFVQFKNYLIMAPLASIAIPPWLARSAGRASGTTHAFIHRTSLPTLSTTRHSATSRPIRLAQATAHRQWHRSSHVRPTTTTTAISPHTRSVVMAAPTSVPTAVGVHSTHSPLHGASPTRSSSRI